MMRKMTPAGLLATAAAIAMPSIAAGQTTPGASGARAGCVGGQPPQGEVVAVDGAVTLLDSAGTAWRPGVGDQLCAGDRIETGPRARLEFRLAGRNTTTGMSGNTVTVIPGDPGECVGLERGVLAFLSSVFTTHCVSTPLIDAGIDGTRAVLQVEPGSGDTLVVALEDVVRVADRRGGAPTLSLDAAAGQGGNAAFATAGQPLTLASPDNVPPVFRDTYLNPEGAVEWAIYYPPILLAAGDFSETTRTAAALIDAGELDAAAPLLDRPAASAREEAARKALASLAALARNDRAGATALSERAVAADPTLGAAHIARSYAFQAGNRLEDARASAVTATEVAPEDAYAWARRAELDLSVGDRRAAAHSVERSLEIEETALGRTIEGFVRLAEGAFDPARDAFGRAVQIDSEAPLPRLGLGLVEIRRGDIAKGREELETAVALAPNRAALRLWLGRAYLEEARPEKAETQFAEGRRLDPDDPNSFFFDATRLFAENRPIEALAALDAAQALGEARGPVRSRQGLAEDSALRSAGTARVLDTLGLNRLAVIEGSRADAADPANPEAHRLLSEVLSNRIGSETAGSSETLRANLLSPPELREADIFLNEADLSLLQGTGPRQLTFSEYSPVFNSNGFLFSATGIVGTQSTFGDEASVSVLHDGFAASAGQLFFTTDGYRPNNDIEHRVYQLQTTIKASPDFTFFGEVRRRETEAGDRLLRFDIDDFDETFRTTFDRDTARAGFRAAIDHRQDVIAVLTYAELETVESFTDPLFLTEDEIANDERSLDGQVQYIGRFDNLRIVAGASFASIDADRVLTIVDPFFDETLRFPESSDIDQQGFYGYAYLNEPRSLRWTLGLSVDRYRDSGNPSADRLEANPKFGVEYDATDWLTFRGAYIQSLSKRLVSEQTIEPTTVAGFLQFEDTRNAVAMERVGAGVDARVGPGIRLGAEATYTEFEFPFPGGIPEETEETEISGYAGIALSDRFFLTLRGSYEKVDSNLIGDIAEYEVISGSAALNYFHPRGFFAKAEVEAVHNRVLEQQQLFEPPPVEMSDTFPVLNAQIGYRLPNERGAVSLELQNILDQDFNFQEREIRQDVVTQPRFAREFTAIGRLTINF